jgi:2-oxoisovalerate dehydrogenase E2 component (dihydrolipoyl transacylase)
VYHNEDLVGVSPIKMPQLGESVTEGTVDRWLKQEGEFVKRDEPLVEVVTDKVNAEIPSPFEGKLLRISVPEGQTVSVGVEIAQIETAGAEAISGDAAPPPPQAAAETSDASAAVQETARATAEEAASESTALNSRQSATSGSAVPVASADGGGRQRFSPAVRRLAQEHGLDPATVPGTGLGGRVTRDDVLAFVQQKQAGGQPPAPAAPAPDAAAPPGTDGGAAVPAGPAPVRAPAPEDGDELLRLSAMRRSIAEHMVRSVTTAPHAWTLQEVDVTELVKYREGEKEGFRGRNGVALTYLPFVIQVVCEALREYPMLNSSWADEGVIVRRQINMGIAVAVPDGLIVPVIRAADRLGFTDLARAVQDLVDRARDKRLKPEDVQGGTFTLNNTGPTGSVASQPIINQPQAAILTTESIVRRPVVIGDGIAVRHMMNTCLSFDHRIVDGMMAGSFLGAVRKRLEGWSPASIRM